MEGLFRNADDALRYAFNFSSQQHAQSQMGKMMKASGRTGKGLIGDTGAGQSGMILAELRELRKRDPAKYHCLVIRYAPRVKKCGHCAGEAPTSYWREAVVALADWSMTVCPGSSQRMVREAIIMKYFGEKISIAELSREVNIPERTIYDMRSKIINALIKLDNRAQEEVGDLLTVKYGLIEAV